MCWLCLLVFVYILILGAFIYSDLFFFFFHQKTAYEMRISDWSSDVCSSDLLYTKVAQVVAEAFQVDIDRVKITATSTGKVPNTSATAASSGSDINGMAALAACDTIKGRLVDFATENWEVPAGQVAFQQIGRAHV